jgi:hypothetical protein
MFAHPIRIVRPLVAAALLSTAASVASAQQAPTQSTTPTDVTLGQEERARYVGVYETETPEGVMKIHIFEDGERLMGRPENETEPSPLTPLGDHRFRPELATELVLTFTVENNRASHFALTFPDDRGTLMAYRRD